MEAGESPRAGQAGAASSTNHRTRASGRPSTAAGPAAGFLYQFERALWHLAKGGDQTVVGIEALDDVTVIEGEVLSILEQDKHSIDGAKTVGDRSSLFWKTLDIWLSEANERPTQYLFVTRSTISGTLLLQLAGSAKRQPQQLLKALKNAGAVPARGRRTKIQTLIDRVLAKPDSDLTRVLLRVRVVQDSQENESVANEIAARFGVVAGPDRPLILKYLRGWLQDEILRAWRDGRPGYVSRDSCLRQCRTLEARFQRRRILPLPSSQVPVTPVARAKALSRNFVAHLDRINADPDERHDAVDQFIRFNLERHRLARIGDIPVDEWSARADRLRERWTVIMRKVRRDLEGKSPSRIGRQVLTETTLDHREPLDGHPCDELYMTSGHYHRLADADAVWWDPVFKVVKTKRGG